MRIQIVKDKTTKVTWIQLSRTMKLIIQIQKLQVPYRIMNIQQKSQNSFDTISIKFTENNLPSTTLVKNSQDHISLTYTVSLQHITRQELSFSQNYNQNNISIDLNKETIESQDSTTRYNYQNHQKNPLILQQIQSSQTKKDIFKKKSILKISNIDFSPFIGHLKEEQTSQATNSKRFVARNNTGNAINSKFKCTNNQNFVKTKLLSSSKENIYECSQQNFTEALNLHTSKFSTFKNQKLLEPSNGFKKKSISLKRQLETKNSPYTSSERKTIRFPHIRCSNNQNLVSTSLTQRLKAISSHENAQTWRNIDGLGYAQKAIIGKSYKISEDDQKARKYIQKIIQNRNCIQHFDETKNTRFNIFSSSKPCSSEKGIKVKF